MIDIADPTAPGCAFIASAIIAFLFYVSEKRNIKGDMHYLGIILGSALIGGLIGWIFIRSFLTIIGILPPTVGGEFDFMSNFIAGAFGGVVGLFAGAIISE